MNAALAARPAQPVSTALASARPAVLIDGVLDDALAVESFKATLPMDQRSATLACHAGQVFDWRGQAVTIALPHRLSDGEVRWQVLLHGTHNEDEHAIATGKAAQAGQVLDDLARVLADRVSVIAGWPDGGIALGDLIQRIAALIGAEAVFACDVALLDLRVESASPPTDTLAGKLLPALDLAGLMIRQDLSLQGDGVRRVLTVSPERSGRRVALPWPGAAGTGAMVESVQIDSDRRPPRLWIGRGGKPAVEDTFALQPGWDPALQGAADSEYARLTSSDFSLYGAVYRSFVLNEDGAYNEPPYNLGSAFDVGALFGAPGTIGQPLRFTSCLTRGTSGRAITPVIESSTDSGTSWSAYPGSAQVMTDRCGVSLADDTLPASILSAAKAGTLRLRVTASITGPDRIQERRWDGNPFAGPAPARVIPFGERFGWRRVAPTSIHAPSIDAGALAADTADDRAALRAQVQALVVRKAGSEASATVRLHGAWTALCVGDRARAVLGPGLAMDGRPSRFDGPQARVRELVIGFGVGRSTPMTTLKMD